MIPRQVSLLKLKPEWTAAIAGLCSSLVGIGLARFAYTPLLPALISNGWFSPSTAAYLGASNLIGYLAGALSGRFLVRQVSTRSALRILMLLTAFSFFASASPKFGIVWMFGWRVLAGYTGGAIMVLAAPLVLAHTPASRRGLIGGVIFTGVGFGIAASGTLVPLLLRLSGLEGTWIGLGILSLLLTALTWMAWPADSASDKAISKSKSAEAMSGSARSLLIEYGLNAVGLVPHMLFLVSYIARGLGYGLGWGAGYWVLFGCGAIGGPLIAGRIADRVGFQLTLRAGFIIQIAAVILPVLFPTPLWLAVSSIIIGAFTPGIVPLVLGRIQELIADPPMRQRVWAYATAAFALAQAISGYGYSYLVGNFAEAYSLLFVIGAVALGLALVLDIAVSALNAQQRS
jgi:predicted MFS family arabinose efflux permease